MRMRGGSYFIYGAERFPSGYHNYMRAHMYRDDLGIRIMVRVEKCVKDAK